MEDQERRTGLGTVFVKQVIENENFYYCNRSKAEAAADLADKYVLGFCTWIKKQGLSNSEIPIESLLKMYKNQKRLS